MVGGQVVEAGLAEAALPPELGLPYRVGAPQLLRFSLGVGIEAVGAGDLPIIARFCHQGAFPIQVVGGAGAAPLGNAFADPAPKGVVAVAHRGVALAELAQAFAGVVLVAALPTGPCLLAGVALRRVADVGLLRLAAGDAEVEGARVAGELVVRVVEPGAGLVGAVGAVACCVVAVASWRQALGLQGVVWAGLGQAAQAVVAVGDGTGVAVDLADVARRRRALPYDATS